MVAGALTGPGLAGAALWLMVAGLIAAGSIAAGCGPLRDPFAPGSVPRLPAPIGEVYTDGLAVPPDPVVRRAAAGLPWDEVLSGAAAGLALAAQQGEPVNAYRVRWKAVLAGWMHPVQGVAAQRMGFDEVPRGMLEQAAEAARAAKAEGREIRVGLARARSVAGDQWVLLLSAAGDVGPVAREPEAGAEVQLVGARFWLADPGGAVHQGVSGAYRFAEAGGWMAEARGERGEVLARFPLFVGGRTPLTPPVGSDAEAAPGDAAASAAALYGQIRAWSGEGAVRRDATLDSVARARLRAWEGGGVLPPAEQAMRAAGFYGGQTGGLECEAATVAACLDGAWWSLDDHAMFAGGWRSAGFAAAPGGAGVRAVIVLAE